MSTDVITCEFPNIAVRQLDHTMVGGIGLLWRADRPHAIRIIIGIYGAARPVVWQVDRALLADGLNHPAGIGDLMLMPDLSLPDGIGIELVLARQGEAVAGNVALPLRVAPIRAFLAKTHKRVPPGTEFVDFDIADLAPPAKGSRGKQRKGGAAA